MVCDYMNLFTKDNDLLTEVCQFNVQLMNSFISSNKSFVIDMEMTNDPFADFEQQLLEEINEYKVYDV